MIQHETQIRVRYGETDQMGYLYYGNYAQYYEVGRAELIRSVGLPYKSMEEDYGIMMPVVSMNIRYIRPALYDELLTIKTSLRHLPEQFITFYYEIFNEKGQLLNGATVRLCFMDIKTKKRIPTPEYLQKELGPYFIT
jgi:acyl-CoA thioester hydrolase